MSEDEKKRKENIKGERKKLEDLKMNSTWDILKDLGKGKKKDKKEE